MIKVVKLGGDANSTAEVIERAADFVLSDKKRRVVVTSGPGKRKNDVYKLTQLLFRASKKAKIDLRQTIDGEVKQRFLDILDPLGMSFSLIETQFSHVYHVLQMYDPNNPNHVDELKFFGERCQQYIVAEMLRKKGGKAVVMNPWDLGIILEEFKGIMLFSPASYRFLREKFQILDSDEVMVTAGFGGYDSNNRLRTLPFGGTDISASNIARAIDAELCENVKFVDGYANIDPNLAKGTSLEDHVVYYDYVSFDGATEASGAGAEVIHAHALRPCRKKGYRSEIPIRVCNILKPDAPGTFITDEHESKYKNPNKFITKKDGFYLVTVTDENMIDASGYVADISAMLGSKNIPYDHISSSEDSFTMAIHENNFGGDESRLDTYKNEIEHQHHGAKVKYEPGYSMVVVVNRRTVKTPGLLGKAAAALGYAGISIDFMTQAKEKAMRFGVVTSSAKDAVLEIAKEFYTDEQHLPDLPKM
jgi:aspartate kinase